MERKNVSSGAKWEAIVGYSRAVRMGPFVFVAGTTAVDAEGQIASPRDPYGQARFILQKIVHALAEAGATPRDVVRTRTFLTNAQDWAEVGRAHAEVFRDIRPAATMIEVPRLLAPEALVEIEADAIVPEPAGRPQA
jgi:enamine deaminase RidA (YjgF/YER057c/UK114 family)